MCADVKLVGKGSLSLKYVFFVKTNIVGLPLGVKQMILLF